jgi:hypothetical protein
MKKLAVLALAGLILVSAALYFPTSLAAHDINECYRDHQDCRVNALNLDAPWVKVMLILTVCDVALGKCALGL